MASYCVAKNCEAFKKCCFECEGAGGAYSLISGEYKEPCIGLCEETSCKIHPDYIEDED